MRRVWLVCGAVTWANRTATTWACLSSTPFLSSNGLKSCPRVPPQEASNLKVFHAVHQILKALTKDIGRSTNAAIKSRPRHAFRDAPPGLERELCSVHTADSLDW